MYFYVDCHSDETKVGLNPNNEIGPSQDFVVIDFIKNPVLGDRWTKVTMLSMHLDLGRAKDLMDQIAHALVRNEARKSAALLAASDAGEGIG